MKRKLVIPVFVVLLAASIPVSAASSGGAFEESFENDISDAWTVETVDGGVVERSQVQAFEGSWSIRTTHDADGGNDDSAMLSRSVKNNGEQFNYSVSIYKTSSGDNSQFHIYDSDGNPIYRLNYANNGDIDLYDSSGSNIWTHSGYNTQEWHDITYQITNSTETMELFVETPETVYHTQDAISDSQIQSIDEIRLEHTDNTDGGYIYWDYAHTQGFNRKPSVGNLSLSPSDLQYKEKASLTFDASDTDGTISDRYYNVYKDGSVYQTNLEPGSDVSIDAKYINWTFQAFAVDDYGAVSSENKTVYVDDKYPLLEVEEIVTADSTNEFRNWNSSTKNAEIANDSVKATEYPFNYKTVRFNASKSENLNVSVKTVSELDAEAIVHEFNENGTETGNVSTTLSNGRNTLDVSPLQAGTYQIEVKTALADGADSGSYNFSIERMTYTGKLDTYISTGGFTVSTSVNQILPSTVTIPFLDIEFDAQPAFNIAAVLAFLGILAFLASERGDDVF
ncbi:hypothetical protein [Candidatus Nanohalococcus occultus]|uniref:hypothetical protein n=1 Tax=Candidatus Nanohalococcus occultus TaxID=2978047 RepID=UPI0039DF5206